MMIESVKLFLYSGEIHYFRIPEAAWRDRLARALATGFNTVSTYVPWALHEPREGVIDLEAFVKFLDAVEKSGLDLFVRVGPVSNAELVNEGLPRWLLSDPAAQPIGTSSGMHPGIHHTPEGIPSYLSPRYLECVARWYAVLLPIIAARQKKDGNGPVLAVQLCNEIGMICWLARFTDRAPWVMKMYHAFLRKRYGRIEDLNTAYGSAYSDFSEVEQPPVTVPERSNLRPWLDRAEFIRDYYAEYFGRLAEMARSHGITCELVANIPMFWDYDTRGRGVQAPVTVSQFRGFPRRVPGLALGGAYQMRRFDHENIHDVVVATEAVREIQRGGGGGRECGRIYCVELQTGILSDRPRLYPSDVELNLRVSAAQGLDGINAYMFCGGRNPPRTGQFGEEHEWQAPIASDGTPRPHLRPLEDFGRFLKTFGEPYSRSRRRTVTTVAWYTLYWMTEFMNGDNIRRLQTERESTAFDGLWRLLDIVGRPFELLDVKRRLFTPESHPTLWMYCFEFLERDVQEKLAIYVRAGGRLALWPRFPRFDERYEECRLLQEACGIEETEEEEGNVWIGGIERYSGGRVFSIERKKGDQILGLSAAGRPVIVRRTVGRGELLFVGVALRDNFLYWRSIVARWCDEWKIEEPVRLRPVGEIGAHLRELPSEGAFLTLSNPHELAISLKISLPQLGVEERTVSVPARRAWILPLRIKWGRWFIEWANSEILDLKEKRDGLEIRYREPVLGEEFEIIGQDPTGKRFQGTGRDGLAEIGIGRG